MSEWGAGSQLIGKLDQARSILAGIPMDKLRYFLLIIIGLWAISLSADLFWKLYPKPDSTSQSLGVSSAMPSKAMTKSSSSTDINLEKLQGWHLFGSAEEQPVVEEKKVAAVDEDIDARPTRLSLKLLGVIQSSDPGLGQAVIEHQGKSELFKVGDDLPVGRGVSLSGVYNNKVLIDNRGQMETLLLYEDTEGRSAVASVVKKQAGDEKTVIDQRDNKQLSEMAKTYKEQLLTNPMSLAEVIRIVPASDKDGNPIGYRISPGNDKKQFHAFGLKNGDIVTAVNGVTLDDPAKAMQLYGQIKEATEASFVIQRGGEEINLIVGVSE